MKKPGLDRLIELQRLLQAFNSVDRMVHRHHDKTMRPENDTEHSYNLAMTAWFLAGYFPELDTGKVIKYALVHDLVEIHAGDTYIYDTDDALASKHEREAAAADKLKHDWADFPDIHTLIANYENRADAEARFIYALDKVMPMLQIYIHDGYTWKKEAITLKKLHNNKKDKVALSPEIAPYYDTLYNLLLCSPHLIPSKKPQS